MRFLLLCACVPACAVPVAVAPIAPPLHFEPNRGQVKGRTQWIAQAPGANIYLTGNEAMLGEVHMRLVGARPARMEGLEPADGTSSYFIGAAEEDWLTGIPHYSRVRARNVYPGIDVVYYGSADGDVEYDFVVMPGADPRLIELAFDDEVVIDDQGSLIAGGLRQRRPRVIQDGWEIDCRYYITSGNHVRIVLADYDPSRALTIDPVLEFSTYLGGPGEDNAYGVKLDAVGNILVSGNGRTPAAPTLDPFQQTSTLTQSTWVLKLTPDARQVMFYAVVGQGYGGATLALDHAGNVLLAGRSDASLFPLKNAFQSACPAAECDFVAKLAPDGRSIVYASFLSGSGSTNNVTGIVADAQENVYFVGTTLSHDFPTKNAIQADLRGLQNCFVAKVSANGGLLFSTYLGSSGIDGCRGAAIGVDDSLIFGGSSVSSDFPTTADAMQTTALAAPYGSPVLVRMAPDGQSLIQSTYLGGELAQGSLGSPALDAEGNIYLVGRAYNSLFAPLVNSFQTTWHAYNTGLLVKLDPTGKEILYSTFFGGSGGAFLTDVVVATDGKIYTTGLALSDDFPTKAPLQPFRGGNAAVNSDGFVTVFTPSGKSLVYSTPIGGAELEWLVDLEVDAAGAVYAVGWTRSRNFPVKNAYQPTHAGGNSDAILVKITDTTPDVTDSQLQPTPARVTIQYVQGEDHPPPQTVAVTGPEAFFVTTSAPEWLSARVEGAMPPNSVVVSVNPDSLPPGTHVGTVTLHPTPEGPAAAIDVSVTVYAPAPLLTGTEPELIPAGSDDTVITVQGSGFVPETQVDVDGVGWTLTPLTVVDGGTIRFQMPKAYLSAEYNFAITARNPHSLPSNAVALAVGKPGPRIAAGGVANAASYAPPPVSVGEMVVIFGENFGSPDTVKVLFDYAPATIIYATPAQIAATVPVGVTNRDTTTLVVQSGDISSPPVVLPVAAAAPALFAADASGQGQAAALNQDSSINGVANPAMAGSVVQLFGTGGGVLTSDELPRVAQPVTVTVNGVEAEVLYAGVAPGLPEGALQVNVEIPPGTAPGMALVVLRIGGVAGNTVHVAVQ